MAVVLDKTKQAASAVSDKAGEAAAAVSGAMKEHVLDPMEENRKVYDKKQAHIHSLKEGSRVSRNGDDWPATYGDIDGGAGSLGTVISIDFALGWASVEWDAGQRGDYRWGSKKKGEGAARDKEDVFELQISDGYSFRRLRWVFADLVAIALTMLGFLLVCTGPGGDPGSCPHTDTVVLHARIAFGTANVIALAAAGVLLSMIRRSTRAQRDADQRSMTWRVVVVCVKLAVLLGLHLYFGWAQPLAMGTLMGLLAIPNFCRHRWRRYCGRASEAKTYGAMAAC